MTASPRPRRKMSSAGRFWLLMGATLVLGGVTGGVYAWLENTGGEPGPLVSSLILFAVFGLIIAGTIWWWIRADEAVREAHKWSWYWGGSIGMCVGLGALLLAAANGGDTPVAADATYGSLMIAGASLVLLPMLIGYGVAWFAWWVSKRV